MKTHIERDRRKAFRVAQTAARNGGVAMPATVPGAAPKAAPKPKARAMVPTGAGSRSASPNNNLGVCPYYNKGQ
eukprot:3584580-Heterocapsa_arctica.AAC.1